MLFYPLILIETKLVAENVDQFLITEYKMEALGFCSDSTESPANLPADPVSNVTQEFLETINELMRKER